MSHEHTIDHPSRTTVGIAFSRHRGHGVPDCGGVGDLHHLCRRLHLLSGQEHQRAEPHDVLELPIFGTICLLSSSLTVYFAVAALRKNQVRLCSLWLAATVLLGSIFLAATAREWYQLIYKDGLTIRTNLFGTTFYSLVGLHATHVIVGLLMLTLALAFGLLGQCAKDTRNALRYCRSTGILWMLSGLWSSPSCTFSADKTGKRT